MPHRDCCTDAINLLDALTGELAAGKQEASARVAMDLIRLQELMRSIKVELKELRKKKRR